MLNNEIHSVMDNQECPKDNHKISNSCLDCSYCLGYFVKFNEFTKDRDINRIHIIGDNAFYACRYEERRKDNN